MLQMLLPWSKKQSPRPRKSLRAGPVWSWVVALAFRRVYPVPVWNVRRKMFVDDCFPTTFPYQIPSQIQPTCCSWCWTLESWQLVATQPIKQVLSCCTFGCYRLCFGYGAIDLGPGFGFLGRLVKNILCCWKIEGSEGRFYGCFPFPKHSCSMSMYVTVDMTVSELHRFCFYELIHQRKSCSNCNSGVHHCIKAYRCNTCRTCCKQPLTNKASIDDMNVEKHDLWSQLLQALMEETGWFKVVVHCCSYLWFLNVAPLLQLLVPTRIRCFGLVNAKMGQLFFPALVIILPQKKKL